MKQRSVNDILADDRLPVVAIDDHGLITFVNKPFEHEYGWTIDDLLGQVITVIMPAHMRDAHNFGFSRFLVSENPRILNQPLSLPILHKDGTETKAEHYITGDNEDGTWRFAATITPEEK